ncbi:MAG: DUF1828 domain-containing protein [Thermodesulfovibrio sp.]|nr:DUF1828 domain-containing protein [Thermodesulfovibrio sp.]
MDVIRKSIVLPKIGQVRITFYRDKRKSTKDKTTFSMPFDLQSSEEEVSGEIIYSPVFRSCRILWNETPLDERLKEGSEGFIKEFLFGELMSVTEPIDSQEAQEIFQEFIKFFNSSIKVNLNPNGTLTFNIPVFGKVLSFVLRKKDTGEFILNDEGITLRKFRPYERGQKDKVIYTVKKLGMEIRDEEIYMESSKENLAENIIKFIQLITSVHLFYFI